MSAHFLDVEPSLANQWRAVILFGLNTASYKFALSEVLLSLPPERDLVRLDELALPYAKAICRHLASAPKQATGRAGRFLDACACFNAGELTEERLREATIRLGFGDVLDAFHNLASRELPARFFLNERRASGGVRLTDAFHRLAAEHQPVDLRCETEARWRLVETAWELGLKRALVSFNPDEASLTVDRGSRRAGVTSCRHALNGYQKGRCFYCSAPISVVPGGEDLADVDHFFPHVLRVHLLGRNLDGVWNLVLACPPCNRGPAGKSDRIPSVRLLKWLHARNEHLIGSHHPLRETLILQTGVSAHGRAAFLQSVHAEARDLRVHDWEPERRGREVFGVG